MAKKKAKSEGTQPKTEIDSGELNLDIAPEAKEGEEVEIDTEGLINDDNKEEGLEALSGLAEESEDLKDQLLRAVAETENIRRRSEKEISQAKKYGHASFARDLLSTVVNLGRAVEALPKETKDLDEATRNLVIGVEMIYGEIGKILERHGITKIDPIGEKFDHTKHQAMFEVETDEAEAGTVVQVAQPGWMLYDRLLSPAMVGVAKTPNGQNSEENK